MSVPYFLFTFMYVKVCTADVPCTDGYINFKKCTDSDTIELCTYIDVSFRFQLFVLPCWLACRQGLAAARRPQLLQRQREEQLLPHLGRRCGGAARVLDASLVLGRCSSVLLGLRICA